MPPESPSSPAPGDERAQRIREVIRGILEDRRRGVAVDLSRVARLHTDLMPELSVQLRTLSRLESAVRAAAACGADESEPLPLRDDDVEVLRTALTGYEILERVRYGGQGVVYRARQRGTGRIVAVKVLIDGPLASDRQRYRFEREIELTSRLQHPNIVTLFESGVVLNRPYFAMEFIEGNPIDDYVILHDLAPQDVVRIMIPVCHAVNYAHRNGVIHRDLNPSNILVDAKGQPHVMDFGLAKDAWERVEPRVSMPGQVIGTLPFLSPEQADGLSPSADVRTDVYALGVTLFHAICADFPYPVDGDPRQARRNIIEHPPRSLRQTALALEPDRRDYRTQLNADLDAIVQKALAKEPDERYQSAVAFAHDLERYLAGEEVEARRHVRSYRIRKAIRRYRVPLAVSGLLLSVALVSGVAVTLALFRARAERDSARQATRIAHQTLELVVGRIDSEIAPLAGGMTVRDRLLTLVDEKLAQLRPLVAADGQLTDVLAALLEREGDLALARGAYGPAADKYRAMLERLEARQPSDGPADDVPAAVARGYVKLVRCTENPERDFPRAIAAALRLAESSGDAAQAVTIQAEALLEIGRRYVLWARYEDADRYFAQAIELLSGLSRRDPGDELRRAALLAAAHENYGTTRQRLGDLAGCGRARDSALALRSRLVALSPANVEFRHALMQSLSVRATYLSDMGRISQAVRDLEDAIDHGEYLVRVEPTVTAYRRDLAGARTRLAHLYAGVGQFGGALLEAEAAVADAEELDRLAPNSPDWLRAAPLARLARGRALRELGHWLPAMDDCVWVYDTLMAAPEPERADTDVKGALYGALGDITLLYGEHGSAREAAVCGRQAFELACELYERDLGDVSRGVDFVAAALNLAGAHYRAGTGQDLRQAEHLMAFASDLLAQLRSRNEFSAYRHRFDRLAETLRSNERVLRLPGLQ